MTTHPESDRLRNEIAALAARLIAEEGENYGNAKQRAVQQLFGKKRLRPEAWPDNAMVENEVRIYQQIFMADEQPRRLRHLREVALALMTELVRFQPRLDGAVYNGTAGEHSDIHLSLLADSSKDVQIFLLNRDVSYTATLASNRNSQGKQPGGHRDQAEVLSFLYRNEGVHLTCESPEGARQGNRRDMGDIAAVRELLSQSSASNTMDNNPDTGTFFSGDNS